MSHRSEKFESDLKHYERRYYDELKKDHYKVKISNSIYNCPFCSGSSKQYLLRELLRHASRVGGSQSIGVKEKARHLALERYIDRHLDGKRTSEHVIEVACPKPDRHASRVGESQSTSVKEKARLDRHLDRTQTSEPVVKVASGVGDSQSTSLKEKARLDGHLNGKQTSETVVKVACPMPDDDQLFVWPWMGILANIGTELKDGRHVGESGTKLREEFITKGFNPLRVHPLWNRFGHSGFAIVEFNKDWDGFINAMNFERSFEEGKCGKTDYYHTRNRGYKLYGWLARDQDYNSKSLIGDYLRRNGDLKTVSGKEAEDKRKTSKLLSGLANTLVMRNMQLKEVENKYYETSASLNKLIAQNDEMIKSYNDEIIKMQQNARDYFEKIFMDHEKARLCLEDQKKELEKREKQLQQRQEENKTERTKLYLEKQMIEKATMEQKKADQKVVCLAEEQKKEKEKLHEKIFDLERKLDAKQALELEIQRMRGALQVMKHMGEDEDMELKKKMDALNADLKEKEEELETMEELNQALIVKERLTNDELQDARKALISGIGQLRTRAIIGVKRMGELDSKPFQIATKRKCPDYEMKTVELCSQWEEYLKDPDWYPFKTLMDKEGNAKRIINEEDEKLKGLKDEFGDGVFSAVVNALMELNEYNASGRYTVPELWNFKEGRKASLKEGVSHLLKQWKLLKRRKT